MNTDFKIRCSAICSIMGGTVGITQKQKEKVQSLIEKKAAKTAEGKDITEKQNQELEGLLKKAKDLQLPTGAKTHVKNWVMEQVYGRRKEISSKYCDKGNACEDDAILLAERVLDLPFCVKNEGHLSDGYFTGTPDLILKDEIIDIKCSWDFSTFPLFDKSIKNQDYYWQLQGYMWLTKIKSARLVYCLMDTPADLIEQDAKALHYKHGYEMDKAREISLKAGTFSDLSDNLRIKSFNVPYDQSRVDAIIERVKLCKAYALELFAEIGIHPALSW